MNRGGRGKDEQTNTQPRRQTDWQPRSPAWKVVVSASCRWWGKQLAADQLIAASALPSCPDKQSDLFICFYFLSFDFQAGEVFILEARGRSFGRTRFFKFYLGLFLTYLWRYFYLDWARCRWIRKMDKDGIREKKKGIRRVSGRRDQPWKMIACLQWAWDQAAQGPHDSWSARPASPPRSSWVSCRGQICSTYWSEVQMNDNLVFVRICRSLRLILRVFWLLS